MITGSASGIGRAIAQRFLDEGAHVVRLDRDADAMANDPMTDHEHCVDLQIDLSREHDIEGLSSRLDDVAPTIDSLVNAAGVVATTPFATLPAAEWNNVLAINLTAPFLLARSLAPRMLDAAETRGEASTVVNITSIEAHIVIASSGETQPHYAASKGGLTMLTKALAVELAPHVRVTAIAPGLIETPLTSSIRGDQSRLEYYLSRTPMDRMGRPEDVAAAAAFLSSDDAAFITGSTLFVDGGWMAL